MGRRSAGEGWLIGSGPVSVSGVGGLALQLLRALYRWMRERVPEADIARTSAISLASCRLVGRLIFG